MWGLRDYEHRRAVNALEARTYNGAIRCGSRPIPSRSIRSTGTAWWRRPPSSHSRRWIPWPRKSIPRASSKFATSPRRPHHAGREEFIHRARGFWTGRNIPSPKPKLCNLRRQGSIVGFSGSALFRNSALAHRRSPKPRRPEQSRTARPESSCRGGCRRHKAGSDRRS